MSVNYDKLTEPLDNMRTSAEVLLMGAFGAFGGDQRENIKTIYINAGALYALFMDIITNIGLENVVKRANLRRRFDELSQPIIQAKDELAQALDGPLNEEQLVAVQYISDLIDMQIAYADAIWLYAALHNRYLHASLQPFSPQLLIEYAQEWANENDATIIINAPKSLPTIFADIKYMRRVIREILYNAQSAVQADPIDIQLSITDDHLHIRIHDDGLGIDAEYHEKIFDPFFQITRYRDGLGLGLTIARELLALQNGQLLVESQLGFGTTIIIVLPLAS